MTTTNPVLADHTVNALHTPRCFAHALICAVENLRDSEGMTADRFELEASRNTPFHWADAYLADGTATCLCEEAK